MPDRELWRIPVGRRSRYIYRRLRQPTKIFPRAIVLIVMINVRVGKVLCDVHPFIYISGCTSAHAQREVLEREHCLERSPVSDLSLLLQNFLF